MADAAGGSDLQGPAPPVPGATLRSWLRRLYETDRLIVMQRGVPLKFTLAALAKRLDGVRAAYFPSPDGHRMPVVSGLVSSRAWIAEAMGTTEDRLVERFQQAAAEPRRWREVEHAPVQEVVHREVDLEKLLPLPTHHEMDRGPYVTAGVLIGRNPRTHIQNVSINRAEPHGPHRLGVLLLPRDLHAYHRMAEAAGEPLPVAMVVGADPLTLLASQAVVPIDHDELEISSALRGEPLEVVKCLTNDVRVPAHAEIVIEGRVLPEVREPEGPFGEFPKYYGPRSDSEVIEVTAVTHRRDAIFHTIVPACKEHLLLGAIPREATVLTHLQRTHPNVVDVHLSEGGVCRYHLYVKLRKTREGQAKGVITSALGAHYDIKQVVVVDEDVDVHDPTEVEWAVSTRFQADRDLVVITGTQGSQLDPSSAHGVTAKMGMDATVPTQADEFRYRRVYVPGEETIDPDTMVDPAPGAELEERLGVREVRRKA